MPPVCLHARKRPAEDSFSTALRDSCSRRVKNNNFTHLQGIYGILLKFEVRWPCPGNPGNVNGVNTILGRPAAWLFGCLAGYSLRHNGNGGLHGDHARCMLQRWPAVWIAAGQAVAA